MTTSEIALNEAWSLLESDERALLIDVRTKAEWNFVGVPDLLSIDKQVRLVEWTRFPDGSPNPDFLTEAIAGVAEDQPVLFLCRSGVRSLAAAKAFEEAGFSTTFNVTAGFEGDLKTDGCGHRHDGWKDFLPWKQT
jgi:rhodanese-related sulfurtransferase